MEESIRDRVTSRELHQKHKSVILGLVLPIGDVVIDEEEWQPTGLARGSVRVVARKRVDRHGYNRIHWAHSISHAVSSEDRNLCRRLFHNLSSHLTNQIHGWFPKTSSSMDLETFSDILNDASTFCAVTSRAVCRSTRTITLPIRLQLITNGGPAARTVYEITELLELILQYLPIQPLYRVQRVSRRFRQVLASSATFRQAMFFAATTEPHCIVHKMLPSRGPTRWNIGRVPAPFKVVALNLIPVSYTHLTLPTKRIV